MSFSPPPSASPCSSPASPPIDLDDRAARLVAAARDLANETGSAAFTVAQVASRAGLSLKSFYRCFQGKDDLLIALLAEESTVGAVLLEQLIAERATAGDDPLRLFVEEFFALATLRATAGYAGVLVREHRRLTERQPAATRAALRPLTDVIAHHIESVDPARDAQTVFSVLIGGFHEVVCGQVTDVREHAAYLYRFCSHGLQGAS
jgi:AcrR family transcriptional regulator